MVRDINIALRALHDVLVAASTPALLSIIDSTEAIPIWMADATID